MKYTVIKAYGNTVIKLIEFDNEKDAHTFCDYYEWCMYDESGFYWDLYIDEEEE